MDRDELAELVLTEVQKQCDAARSRPRPPAWQTWLVCRHEADIVLGPCYSPTWFGNLTATEAGRVRLLRVIYRLSNAGLLTLVKSEGGRLERVRLTTKGIRAARSIRNAGTPTGT
jgi:hypothetical protein